MKIFSQIITVLIFAFSHTVFAKRVSLSWREIPGAEKYELELYKGDSRVPYKISTLRTPQWKKELDPNWYFFKVRAIDVDDQPGEWSNAVSLLVPPEKTQWKKPELAENIEHKQFPAKVEFKWTKVSGPVNYLLEIKKSNKVVFSNELVDNSVEVELSPGDYTATLQTKMASVQSPLMEKETSDWKSEAVLNRFTLVQGEEKREVAAIEAKGASVESMSDSPKKYTAVSLQLGSRQWAYESNQITKTTAYSPLMILGFERSLNGNLFLFGEGSYTSCAINDLDLKSQKAISIGLSRRTGNEETADWRLLLDLAPTLSDAFEITPLASEGTSLRTQITTFTTLGLKAKIGLSKRLSSRLKSIISVSGNFPFLMASSDSGRQMEVFSSRSLQASLTGSYEVNPRFDLGIRGYWESQQLRTLESTDAPAQNVQMQSLGALLFTSVRF